MVGMQLAIYQGGFALASAGYQAEMKGHQRVSRGLHRGHQTSDFNMQSRLGRAAGSNYCPFSSQRSSTRAECSCFILVNTVWGRTLPSSQSNRLQRRVQTIDRGTVGSTRIPSVGVRGPFFTRNGPKQLKSFVTAQPLALVQQEAGTLHGCWSGQEEMGTLTKITGP